MMLMSGFTGTAKRGRNTSIAGLVGPALLCLALVITGGCATVDFDAPKTESVALTDTHDTRLGRALEFTDEYPQDHSGFYLLSDAIDALAARLLLAYLALEAGVPHRREALAGLLWTEQGVLVSAL